MVAAPLDDAGPWPGAAGGGGGARCPSELPGSAPGGACRSPPLPGARGVLAGAGLAVEDGGAGGGAATADEALVASTTRATRAYDRRMSSDDIDATKYSTELQQQEGRGACRGLRAADDGWAGKDRQ